MNILQLSGMTAECLQSSLYSVFNRLADHLFSLQCGESQSISSSHETKMLTMVDYWAAKFTFRQPNAAAKPKPKNARVVVRVLSTFLVDV